MVIGSAWADATKHEQAFDAETRKLTVTSKCIVSAPGSLNIQLGEALHYLSFLRLDFAFSGWKRLDFGYFACTALEKLCLVLLDARILHDEFCMIHFQDAWILHY